MAVTQGPLTQLAKRLLEACEQLDAHNQSKNSLPASFEEEWFTKLDLATENRRKQIIDDAQDLKRLAQGPRDLLFELYNQFTDLASLHFIYRHKVPRHVPVQGSISYADLARKLGQDDVLVRRMLRMAMINRIFAETPSGEVRHSAASTLLCVEEDALDAMGFFIEELFPAAPKMIDALDKYPKSSEPNQTGFNLAFNTSRPFYLELDSLPARSRRFGAAMRWNTMAGRFDDDNLVRAYDWTAVDRADGLVVDIGGGHGAVSRAVARATKNLQCLVQDLPVTAAHGEKVLPAELEKRVKFMPHDFFQEQPVKGADVYMMRFILHNWADEYAVRILRNLLPALKDGARILCFDFMPGDKSTTKWTEKQPLNMDMIQAIGWNSIERTASDWQRLFTAVDPRLQLRSASVPPQCSIAIVEAEFVASGVPRAPASKVNGNGVHHVDVTNGAHKELVAPVIDVSAFLSDPNSAASAKIINEVRDACQNTGFFQLVGHGLSTEVTQGILKAGASFFGLPYEQKVLLDAKKVTGHRGYDVLSGQAYHAGTAPDLKEGFFVGQDVDQADPDVANKRFFMGQNVWPSNDLLPKSSFRQPVEAYYNAIHHLALRVLDLISRTLVGSEDIFRDFTKGNTVAALRLLHYPPAPVDASGEKQIGAGAHTDFGAITLLLQDDNAGLEVKDPTTGAFVAVDPVPGALVFNVGDILDVWTGGRYRSSVHRVVNKKPVDRYSVAFFYDGALDCVLRPLKGHRGPATDLTVERHLQNRHNASYGSDEVKAQIKAEQQGK